MPWRLWSHTAVCVSPGLPCDTPLPRGLVLSSPRADGLLWFPGPDVPAHLHLSHHICRLCGLEPALYCGPPTLGPLWAAGAPPQPQDECDILYRWLLNGRLKMATDLMYAEPAHLTHCMLLTLSVMSICPRVLKPNDKVSHLSFTTKPETELDTYTVETTLPM